MPHATTPDGVKLYYEEAGSGTPILFVHEYSGDWRSWEPQMRFFSRRHRCITYSFRGYPGSDVPESGAMYGQQHAVDDAKHMLDHLKIAKAHIVGLSQGAFAARISAGSTPTAPVAHARRLGSGAGAKARAVKKDAQAPRSASAAGHGKYAQGLTTNPTRSRFKQKDPRGFAEFVKTLRASIRRANTMENYRAAASLYDFEGSGRSSTADAIISATRTSPASASLY